MTTDTTNLHAKQARALIEPRDVRGNRFSISGYLLACGGRQMAARTHAAPTKQRKRPALPTSGSCFHVSVTASYSSTVSA